MTILNRFNLALWSGLTATATGVSTAFAQLGGDIPAVPGTVDPGTSTDSVRQTILDILTVVLNFLALIAVIFIIVAGIRLIVSQGSEEQRDTAKKTILYVVVGLLVILFARVIVGFIANLGTDINNI